LLEPLQKVVGQMAQELFLERRQGEPDLLRRHQSSPRALWQMVLGLELGLGQALGPGQALGLGPQPGL